MIKPCDEGVFFCFFYAARNKSKSLPTNVGFLKLYAIKLKTVGKRLKIKRFNENYLDFGHFSFDNCRRKDIII